MQIHLSTTSDWTILKLISGAMWFRHDPIAISEGASNAGMHNDVIVLDQPIDRAQLGDEVEFIVEILFTESEQQKPLSSRLNAVILALQR